MINNMLKKVAKVNNGIGFFLDKETLVTAAHNVRQNGVYNVRTKEININCSGSLNKCSPTILDTLKKGDLDIIINSDFSAQNFFEGSSYKCNDSYYLVGRRFRYPCFKHFENIYVTIKYIFPIELNYLKKIKDNNLGSGVLLDNRIKQVEYCLSSWPINHDNAQVFLYKNTSVMNLEILHEMYSVNYRDALLDEMAILLGVINEELNRNPSVIDAAYEAYCEIAQSIDFDFLSLQVERTCESLIKFGCWLKNYIENLLSPLYLEKIALLDLNITNSYYSQNKIDALFDGDYLITKTSRNKNKYISDNLVLISAPTYPGFSGGPLVDSDGNVQGLIIGGMSKNFLSTTIPFPKKSETIVRIF